MTDITEQQFSNYVEELLAAYFGKQNVERQKYFSETNRFADFWVETPLVTLAIEVDNDFDGMIKGVGQSMLYAGHSLNAVPIVIIPEDHAEYPEINMLRRYINIVEISVPDEEWKK